MVFVLIGVPAHPAWLGLVLGWLFGYRLHIFPSRVPARSSADAGSAAGDAVGVSPAAAVVHLRVPVCGYLRADDSRQRARDRSLIRAPAFAWDGLIRKTLACRE